MTPTRFTLGFRGGYSSVTGRIPLQAIRPALNDFRIGFMSMVGAQATKDYRVRVGSTKLGY